MSRKRKWKCPYYTKIINARNYSGIVCSSCGYTIGFSNIPELCNLSTKTFNNFYSENNHRSERDKFVRKHCNYAYKTCQFYKNKHQPR